MNEEFIESINKINAGWRPALEVIIVISVFIFYVLYPLLCMLLSYYGHNITFPSEVKDSINYILVAGGVLAGLRTIEKTKKVTQNH